MNPIKIEIEQKIIPGSISWKCSNCLKIFLDEGTAALCCFCIECQKPAVGKYCQICEIKKDMKYHQYFIEKHTKEITQLQSILESLNYESKQNEVKESVGNK